MTIDFKENKLISVAIIVYLIWVIIFVCTNYRSEKERLYKAIDKELDTAALSVPILLPENYHHQAMQHDDLTAEQSFKQILKLSDFTRIRKVIYIYSFILRDEKIYFTSSSATDEEIETRDGLSYYFDHYNDADPRVYDVFHSEQKSYLEYSDQWGSFRSVFIPLRSADGTLYVVGADLEISEINGLLWISLLTTLGVAALFLLFAVPLILAFSIATRRLAKKLELRVLERTEELVESEGILNSILEHSPVGIAHYDAAGVLRKVNKGFEQLVGSDRAQLIGGNIRDALKNGGLVKAVDDSLNGQTGHFEGEFLDNNQQQKIRLHAEFVTMKSISGRLLGGVAVFDDRTKQHDAILSLKKLSLAVETSPSVVFVTDRQGVIEYANSRFLEVTGHKPEEVIGETPRILQSGTNDKGTYQHLWNELLRGKCWRGEFENRRKSGELYWARQNIAPICDQTGYITHFVAIQEDVTEARRIQEQNTYHATHDMLTGLVNRFEFERRLERVVDTAKESHRAHAICFVDLDQFKIINDTCGHAAGDELLKQLSAVLLKHLRRRDTLARIGGDEFAVLMEHCDSKQALRVATNIHHIIEQFVFCCQKHNFSVGSSIGLARIDQYTQDATEVLKQADAACYVAKEQGRNRIHVYREDDESLVRRTGEMQWVNVLKRALKKDNFVLYAQVIETVDDSEISYEILLRMIAENGTLVSPGSFLPAAERYSLSGPVDRWVVEHSLKWMEENLHHLAHVHHFAINLSGQSLGDEQFLDYLQKRLRKTTIPAGMICFEITETAALANLTAAREFITALCEFNCLFSLDDFGRGLSSFAYLKNLPVDYLKIDGMFVKHIMKDLMDEAMVKSINEIGHVMQMKTVAEFVENDAIRERLKAIGVDFVQGYGVGMPAPLADIVADLSDKPIKSVV